jgi:hypothetical protein
MFAGIALTGLVVFIRGDIVERRKLKKAAAAAAVGAPGVTEVSQDTVATSPDTAAGSPEAAVGSPEAAEITPASVDGEM